MTALFDIKQHCPCRIADLCDQEGKIRREATMVKLFTCKNTGVMAAYSRQPKRLLKSSVW
jgi:hypothetical protein